MRQLNSPFRLPLSFMLLLSITLLLGSCVKDNSGGGVCPGDLQETQIKLLMGDMQEQKIETRSEASTNERWISDAYVLVFGSDGKYKNGGKITISSTTVSGNGTDSPTITAPPIINGGDTVVVLCNTGCTFSTVPLTKGVSTTADINGAFPATDWNINQMGNTDTGRGMPMSGEAKWNISTPPTIQMNRSVAKIQVGLDASLSANDITGNFSREKITWNVKNKLFDNRGNIYPTGTSPVAPAGLTEMDFQDQTILTYTVSSSDWSPSTGDLGGGSSVPLDRFKCYLPEYPTSTKAKLTTVGPTVWHRDRTCVLLSVVGAAFPGSAANGYYRIDLATGNDRTKTFLDVKRNCHYKITITKVKSYGYPTEAEALKNPGSNLEYEVVITGDDENFTTSNGQYAVTTDKKDVAILDDVTTAENLVKFICKRHSSQSDASIDTRTVRLVGADKTTLIPATKLQMCKSDGTAIPGNTLTFTVSDETGYQLKFTSPDAASLPDEQVYVEICFGNIRHYVPVNAYVFKVSQPADYTYTGGTKQYEVTSYKTGSPKTGVSWNAEFSSDGGATWSASVPPWVTSLVTSSTGETTATPYNATIEAQTPSNPHNDRLKAAATLSGINDLSKGGETANCYIVNAPGTYSLPLVYGNARKADGTVDTIAFKPGVWSYGTGNTRLSPFISATGTIPDDGKIAGATNAVLIWQDAKDLVVVDAALSGTYPNQTLTFTVSAANIRQGNAVVAVKESRYNRVLWSWHIWVTDFDPDSPEGDPKSFVNAAGYTYKFMPVNIGWCDGLEYAARNVRVRFTQNESGIQKEMNLNQLVAHKPGNSPYFQWGRKDPFVAGLEGNVNKTWYDSLGVMKVNTPPPYTTAWTGGISGNVIKNGILHPDVYCANTYMDLQYHNLWSARNDISIPIPNDNAVIKSVYDPSPVGYHLPASNAFTGFTTTGTSGTASTINGTWDAVSNSWNLAKSGSDTVNFPCVSYRNRSNSVMLNSGSTGIYWMAVSYTNAGDGSGIINLQYCSQYSSVFSLLSNRITPWGKEYRSYGFSVRPVKD